MATNRVTERKERDIEIPDTLFLIKSWNLSSVETSQFENITQGDLDSEHTRHQAIQIIVLVNM